MSKKILIGISVLAMVSLIYGASSYALSVFGQAGAAFGGFGDKGYAQPGTKVGSVIKGFSDFKTVEKGFSGSNDLQLLTDTTFPQDYQVTKYNGETVCQLIPQEEGRQPDLMGEVSGDIAKQVLDHLLLQNPNSVVTEQLQAMKDFIDTELAANPDATFSLQLKIDEANKTVSIGIGPGMIEFGTVSMESGEMTQVPQVEEPSKTMSMSVTLEASDKLIQDLNAIVETVNQAEEELAALGEELSEQFQAGEITQEEAEAKWNAKKEEVGAIKEQAIQDTVDTILAVENPAVNTIEVAIHDRETSEDITILLNPGDDILSELFKCEQAPEGYFTEDVLKDSVIVIRDREIDIQEVDNEELQRTEILQTIERTISVYDAEGNLRVIEGHPDYNPYTFEFKVLQIYEWEEEGELGGEK